MKIKYGLIFFLIFSFSEVVAQNIVTVKMVAPAKGDKFLWPVITKDGTGLYNIVYNKIFAFKNIKLVIEGQPVNRCKTHVKNDLADFFPGSVKGEKIGDYMFYTPNTAIYYSDGIAIHYKKVTIPHWNGVTNLIGKQLVFVRGSKHLDELENYGDLLKNELDNAYENATYLGALKMLTMDRVEIFVVSNELLLTSISQYGPKYKKELFETQYLNRTKYYPLFQNNEQGKQLARIFDEGMQKLYDSGELQQLYGSSLNATLSNIDTILEKRE